jgi:hypothetical protein
VKCSPISVHLQIISLRFFRARNQYQHSRHLGVPSGASKTISEPMVCSAQTVHLSCVKISTIFKRARTSFHLSLVTRSTICASKMIYEPMVLWRKPCTYLAPTLTFSPNRSKRDSISPKSPRSNIGCVHNDF